MASTSNFASQHTIARAAGFSGIALHSGREVKTRLSPMPKDSGIIFRRTDLDIGVRAAAKNVLDTRLATTLGTGKCAVSTVEHLLSALSALRIDNVLIEVDGPELPILDGSSAPWMLFLTDACGREAQSAPRQVIRVLKSVEAKMEGAHARFEPASGDGPRYTVRIDFPHAAVRRTGSSISHELSEDEYEEEISRARTFCYVGDVETMRRNRRALGGSLGNAVVYDDKGVLNAEGLRYPDEFVRHKVLDAVGDCYISGSMILADYEAYCPGHGVNHALVSALDADPGAWEWA